MAAEVCVELWGAFAARGLPLEEINALARRGSYGCVLSAPVGTRVLIGADEASLLAENRQSSVWVLNGVFLLGSCGLRLCYWCYLECGRSVGPTR